MRQLHDLVVASQAGDVAAFGRLIRATERIVDAVCLRVLREPATAQDATQQAYLRAFRRLRDLVERLAVLRYGIDDIRKIDVASVA